MSRIVQKYGGSSVSSVEQICTVADLVAARARAGDQLVVVVSAMGKTTDDLMHMAHRVSSFPTQRELDMLVTSGERISMALLSMAIADRGVPTVSFTGSQSGIITDEVHQNAQVLEVRPERIEQALEEGRTVVVGGYQGVSRDREVTTLGRGGSDTTAVVLAAAIRADACEIYSDVDGVYSADPRICPQAKHLAEISYDDMQAMSRAGAKVLHAQAVEFAKRAGVVIVARKTGVSGGRQTRIQVAASARDKVTAVVGAEGVCFTGSDIDMKEVRAGGMQPIGWAWTAGRFVGVITGIDLAVPAETLLAQIHPALEIELVAAITAWVTRPDVLFKNAREALAALQIEVSHVFTGEGQITLCVAREDMERAVVAVHGLMGEHRA